MTGWDLPAIIDGLSEGIKRKVIKEQSKKNKPQRFSLEKKYEDL